MWSLSGICLSLEQFGHGHDIVVSFASLLVISTSYNTGKYYTR